MGFVLHPELVKIYDKASVDAFRLIIGDRHKKTESGEPIMSDRERDSLFDIYWARVCALTGKEAKA